MKQLKSNLTDLRKIFENIRARHICEIFQSHPLDTDSKIVKEDIEKKDFDVMGLSKNGIICGYVNRCDLINGSCKDYKNEFNVSDLTSDSTPIIDCISLLKEKKRIFVLQKNMVNGIITRGDLQKAPVRMLLFGLITLLEMQMQRIINNEFPNDTWKKHLKQNRIDKAENILKLRKQRNEDIGLLDCLQFCDKSNLITKIDKIDKRFNIENVKDYKKILSKIEKLRDKIAHSQDIVLGTTWSDIITSIEDLQNILSILESF